MTYRICNLDETKLSLDGSDGGVRGRPCCTIHVKMKFRTGTAANQSGCSSTLICGYNSAGKAMSMFIAFASEAEYDENFRVRADWLVGIPNVENTVLRLTLSLFDSLTDFFIISFFNR